MTNFLLLSDSYKYSHYNQYPEGTNRIFSYFESRGGEYDKVMLNGLQWYVNTYLVDWVESLESFDIDEAAIYAQKHGIPFNRAGFESLYKYVGEHKKLPVEIYSVPENIPLTPKTVLFTIENTVDEFYWLVGWLETLLMKVWYPSTIATKCHEVRKMLTTYATLTSDNPSWVDFAYHNFGDRGSSSVESALIGGLAHLSQFKGTDNFNAAVQHMYDAGQAFSITASEHSTVTSWGRSNEFKFIRNYLEISKDRPIIACVLDSYNIYDAVNYVTGALKQLIESEAYPMFVMRPDSGEPIQVINKILEIAENNRVSFKINSKGYKVWDKYRLIWGDGITPETINQIMEYVTNKGYAADNFAFGSGGDLMQNLTRDTCKFAIKASAIRIGTQWQDVYKDPITDLGKASKRGRLITVKWKSDAWHDKRVADVQTIRAEDFDSVLHEVFMSKVY